MALTRASNPKTTPSKSTSRMRATASARLRMPPVIKKQVKIRVLVDVGRISPNPSLHDKKNKNKRNMIFTNGFNRNKGEIDCIDKGNLEHICLDQ